MEATVLNLRLFQVGLVCFIAGSLLPVLFNRNQKLASTFANGCSLAGGSLIAILAGRLLFFHQELSAVAWRIMGGIVLKVQFDSLAAFFLLIIGVMSAICALYAQGYATKYYEKRAAGYLGAGMNVFILSLVGVVGVDTSVTFLIFWEFMAVSSFFLVMFEHEKQKVRSGGYMYLIMTHVCGVCLSFAFLILYLYTGSLEFAAYKNIGHVLPTHMQSIVFFCFLIGFGAKMGLFPMNVWLPRAYPVAPTSATALMSSAMIKTAVYAFLRVSFDFFGTGPAWWGITVMAVGALSAMVGILLGVIQNDTKRFLAYSSVENMGMICVGIGAGLYFQATGQGVLGALALTATLYHVLNHSVFKSLMFMGAGAVLKATGTCNVGQLGGLIHRMPWTAAAFLIGGMSLASLPPLGGFMSEWALLQTVLHMAFDGGTSMVKFFAAMVVAVLGFSGALSMVAVVKHFGTAFLAKPRSQVAQQAAEVNISMRIGMGLLAVLSLVLGLFPGGAITLIHEVTLRYFTAQISGNLLLAIPFASQDVQMISVGVIGVIFALILLGVLLWLRLRYGKSRYVLEDTWTCGYQHAAKMEYTATSYSHPVLRIFHQVFGLSRQVKMEEQYAYYPKKIHHAIDINARVGDKVYKPMIWIMVKLFKRIRIIQNGNLQAYVSYMVVALILTLLWSR
ncbi:proton-conducting transporter transmembrane domain-containing protein [Anaerosinus massiliensis]|uniref:proton-conducting transporter transmembrane domain-containing protein n=1 Tax=Massilibacillus massiliensis TaxID=1806837 RepID=UPI000DA5FCA7|nr:proton-conducting transporter membrane subunit [Massilibacillus massiliensis]